MGEAERAHGWRAHQAVRCTPETQGLKIPITHSSSEPTTKTVRTLKTEHSTRVFLLLERQGQRVPITWL
jgi:hypothetical protein